MSLQPTNKAKATRRRWAPALFCCLGLLLAGCNGINSPSSNRPPRAQKWYERALSEFRSVSLEAAQDSVQHALDLVPEDEEVRLLAARVALAKLEYDEVVRLLRGLETSDVLALRGRAYWYKGDLDRAADELDKLLSDPEVDDPWAKSITKLARRGIGRRPFSVETIEGRLEVVQMARVEPTAPLYVVPVEIDGDKALAIISTGTAEVMLDSSARSEPSWVSLRFGERLEVKDVPALTQDLSGISTQLGAPIKALLGVNLLRHLNVTLDFQGRQFVARSFVPPPPPVASRLDLYYLRGGGMVLPSAFGEGEGKRATFFVDSSMGHSVALDEGGWRRLGIDARTLPSLDGTRELRSGSIPLLQFGSFKLPQLPAVYGPPIDKVEKELDIDVDGAVGAGLLADFRITFSDGGRVLWIEQQGALPPPPSGDVPLMPPPQGGGIPPGAEPIPPGGGIPLDPMGQGNLLEPEGGLLGPNPMPGAEEPKKESE